MHCVRFQRDIFSHQRSMQLCSFSVLCKFQLMKLHYSFHKTNSTNRKVNNECSLFTLNCALSVQCSHICFMTVFLKSFGRCVLFSARDIILEILHSISFRKRFETLDFHDKLRKEQIFFNDSCRDDNKHQKVKTI